MDDGMTRRNAAAAVVGALSCLSLSAVVAPADAAGTYYSSCAKLTKKYPHGVARSARAAAKQVRQGYGRPATTKKAKAVYKTNHKRLDRDDDGTACEG
jgi:hypothetical protein